MKKKNVFQENPDEKYVGNVFGWKTSFIALAVILFFVGLYFVSARYNEKNNLTPMFDTDGNTRIEKTDTIN